jgi:hypothetical protein
MALAWALSESMPHTYTEQHRRSSSLEKPKAPRTAIPEAYEIE